MLLFSFIFVKNKCVMYEKSVLFTIALYVFMYEWFLYYVHHRLFVELEKYLLSCHFRRRSIKLINSLVILLLYVSLFQIVYIDSMVSLSTVSSRDCRWFMYWVVAGLDCNSISWVPFLC